MQGWVGEEDGAVTSMLSAKELVFVTHLGLQRRMVSGSLGIRIFSQALFAVLVFLWSSAELLQAVCSVCQGCFRKARVSPPALTSVSSLASDVVTLRCCSVNS